MAAKISVKPLSVLLRREGLGRDIVAALVFKLCAIVILWELFFGPAHTVVVTPAKVDAVLFTAPPTPPPSKSGS